MKSLIIIMFACSLIFAQEDPYKLIVDVVPEPVGGYSAIHKEIKYPEMAIKLGTEGKVYLLLLINEKGTVDEVKVIKGIGSGCDEEATNAAKKTKFTPGKLNGEAVKTKLTIPISFKLK